jgi:membrane protein insertase Oxa1/YidC/SpoIIIJ
VIETPPVTSPPVLPATSEITSTTGYIPEPPSLPIEEVILNAIGEPSLQSLGLGSYWTPVGWFQLIFETLHANFNLSWYASILVFTLLVRTLLIPVSIKMQKKNALMRKSGSVLNRAQEKYSAAKLSGNEMESKTQKEKKKYFS